METVTRLVLREAVRREVGLPRREAAQLVDAAIDTICERLVAGEPVKISGFGSFATRDKDPRMGPQSEDPRAGADRGAAGGGVSGLADSDGRDRRAADEGRGRHLSRRPCWAAACLSERAPECPVDKLDVRKAEMGRAPTDPGGSRQQRPADIGQ